MASRRVPPRATLAVIVLLVLGSPLGAPGQSANVLAVLPEGILLPAAPFQDLRPGARMGFRRPDGSTALVGEGWVLDVRQGRALVGLKPGGSVQPGDIGVLCATLSGPGSHAELRTSVQDLKAQLAASGGGSPELQASISQLESALDARESAIRDGACDVDSYDQQVAALSAEIQQRLMAGSVSPPPPPATTGAPLDATAPPATGDAPPPPAGVAQGAPATDTIATTLQLLQQAVQIAQSAGLIRGSTGGQPGVTEPPGAPVSPPSQAPLPTGPDPVQGTPGAGSSLPPGPPPPSTGTSPGSPATGGGGSAPGTGRPPGFIRPPGQAPAPGSSVVSEVPSGSASGTPGAGTTKSPTVTPTFPPLVRPLPGTVTAPKTGQIVRATPTPTPPPVATVRGIVRGNNGVPIQGAVVVVGGKQAATNAQGFFLVTDVPTGHHVVVVSARGFLQKKEAIDLTRGEVEQMTLVLQRVMLAPVPR